MDLDIEQNSAFHDIEDEAFFDLGEEVESLLSTSTELSTSTAISSVQRRLEDAAFQEAENTASSVLRDKVTNTEPSTSTLSSSSLTRKASTIGSSNSKSFSRSVRPKLLVNQVSSEPDPPVTVDTPVIIAHSQLIQNVLDAKNVSSGVRWELARSVTENTFTYDDIFLAWLDELRYPDGHDNTDANAKFAPNAAKFLKQRIMGKSTSESHRQDGLHNNAFAKEIVDRSPWAELDAEEAALRKSAYGCLGRLDHEPLATKSWYGGKVLFSGELQVSHNKPKQLLRIVLRRPELGPSCRFTRRFGSSRFLRIKVPKGQENNDESLIEYFSRPFIIDGRVFRSFFAKDSTVFMFETDEVLNADARSVKAGREGFLSLSQFINWHNAILRNSNQTMQKWSSRMALGLSNSVPGICLPVDRIKYIAEDLSPHWPSYQLEHPDAKKPPSFMEMSDGCGFINQAGLQALKERLNWDIVPTAVQCRVAGAKGLLLLHPDDTENEAKDPKIWIRPSQQKIHYDPASLTDPALTTIDVLAASHMRAPVRLSAEAIVNMGENGVNAQVFIDLMTTGMQELVTSLTNWNQDSDGLVKLWWNVAKVGGVFGARLARAAGGEARARGYSNHRSTKADADAYEDGIDTIDNTICNSSSAWLADQCGGRPSSLAEAIMVLIDSGFTPENCPILKEKLKHFIESCVDDYVKRYNFRVPMSCSAWCVPDPYGVLEPGEIHVKSSERNLLTPEGLTDVLTGDVLIYRNPCKLPTDVQKVKAVVRPELRNYLNVAVFSVKDYYHQAFKLANGDSDGDSWTIIWLAILVAGFKNADLKYMTEPQELTQSIKKNVITVSDFLNRTENGLQFQQQFLLMSLKDSSYIWKYSSMHDNAAYRLGYRHPDTIRLAHMFATLIDAQKNGCTLSQASFARDCERFLRPRAPRWKESIEDRERHDAGNDNNPQRTLNSRFIMDEISSAAASVTSNQKAEIKELFKNCKLEPDSDLTAPWKEAKDIARGLEQRGDDVALRHLEIIEKHVRLMKADYGKWNRSPSELSSNLRTLSRHFASRPSPEETDLIWRSQLQRLKASCAYVLCWENLEKKTIYAAPDHFAFDVAIRFLCAIKADATGCSKTVTSRFYERFAIKKSFIR